MPSNCAAIIIAAKHHELSKVKDTRGTTHTVGALRCKFDFRTADWLNSAKTAMFCNGDAVLHPEVADNAIAVPLDSDNECAVPYEVLTDTLPYSIGVWGVTDTGLRIVSKWLVFNAQEGCYTDGSAPADPETTIYEQILSTSKNASDKADDIYNKANNGEFDGESAYEIAHRNGFTGTEAEWLNSLHGKDGENYSLTETDKSDIASMINITTYVGQKTAEGGEIFNDYENNIAGIKGIASGRPTASITVDGPNQMAFEFDKNTFGEGNIEFPYSPEEELNYTYMLNHDDIFHLANRFKVVKSVVRQDTMEDYDGLLYLVIEDTVKDAEGNYFTYTGMDGAITALDLSKGYFSCTDKPLAGNVIIPDKHMATAMGEGNKSLGRASFVAGRGNKALQDCAAVFGRDNTAGFAATALGRNSDATGEYSFVVGYNANAIGNVGFATGQDTFANGNRSSAFGKGSKANGEGSTAFGHNTYSYGDYTFTQGEGTAAGWGNKVPGQVALGHYNKENQSAILMVGNGTGSGDLRSNAFVVYEDGRAAIKADPKENLDVSTKQYVDAKTNEALNEANNTISAINIPVKAQNTHSLYLNKAESNNIDTSTNYAVVSGANCKIADSSIASFIAGGQRNEIKGQNSFAAGYKNKIYGSKSNAFGDSNIIGKVTIESNMVKEYTTAANYTTVFGWNNNAAISNQFVIGKYNDNKSNSLFEIGNGTSTSNRSNAFVVDIYGNGWFAGDVEGTSMILQSPNGTRFKITVDDNGNLSADKVE